jgi:uncharacterized protein
VKIWLDQVREEPLSWDETERIAPETLERPEVLALGPVRWQGEVTYADPGYLLRGRLSYDQTLACIRCLKQHVVSAQADVELLIVVESPAARGHRPHRPIQEMEEGEQELEDLDLNTMVIADEVLETRPIVLEQLQLNIPMKPLCREDCQGLCPRCGADRNANLCSCASTAPDPRWAALQEIKERLGAPEDR